MLGTVLGPVGSIGTHGVSHGFNAAAKRFCAPVEAITRARGDRSYKLEKGAWHRTPQPLGNILKATGPPRPDRDNSWEDFGVFGAVSGTPPDHPKPTQYHPQNRPREFWVGFFYNKVLDGF